MDSFDVVILGAGAGAKLIWGSVPGRSVAVVERDRVGGECPFVACVPSKAMLRTAHLWQVAEDEQWAELYGGRVSARDAYQAAVRRRDRIVHGRDDSLNATGLEKTGATLLRGSGRVVRPGVLDVGGVEVGYGELVLNTGSAPSRPGVPGLDSVPVWTSDQALSTTDYPPTMAVVGGGPVGCELAFLFATFGTAVTLVQRNARLIPREEPQVSDEMAAVLADVGVEVLLGAPVTGAAVHGTGARLTLATEATVDGDVVVLAAGRRPRSAGLGLEALGVTVSPDGALAVDEHCRVVGAEHLWAVGDVTGVAPFTHTAHYMGRVVAANLSGRDVRADWRVIPRAVYTHPVIASVGHTVASARAAGIEPLVARADMTVAVRSATEGMSDGWVMVLADPLTRSVIGATGVGGHAEEWISEVSLAIRAQIPVTVARDVVHPFPTFGEVLEGPLWELAARLEPV